MSNCIKITYYKIEGGDQKMVTLPSIYLPEGTDFGTDSETQSFVIDSLLKIAKDPSNEAYSEVQNMLNSEVISTSIKKEIAGEVAKDVPVSHAIQLAMSLPGSLVRNSGDIKNLLVKKSNNNLTTSMKLVKKLISSADVDIVFSSESFDSNGKHLPESTESVQGLYFQKEGTIVVKVPNNTELKSNDQLDYLISTDPEIQDSLLHELTHYHTVANIDKPLMDNIQTILNMNPPTGNQEVEDILKSFGPLSTADTAKEFLAYYASNSNFRNAVNDKDASFANKFIGTLHQVAGSEHLASLLNVISTQQNKRVLLESEPPTTNSPLIEEDRLTEVDGQDSLKIEQGDIDAEEKPTSSDDAPGTIPLMRSVPSGELFTPITPIKISSPESAKTHAGSIYNVFKNATGASNKSIKYTLNYGPAITASGYNRALLHKLNQNDIVRVPTSNKNKDGEWEVSGNSTYLPVINTYIDGKTKALKIQVATKTGKTFVVDADDVVSYRSFLGNLNVAKVNVPKGEMAETWANYANMTFGADYTFNGKKIELPEVPKLYQKMTLRDNNFDTKIYDNEVATYVSFNIDKRFNTLANEKLREGDSKNVYTGRDDIYDSVNFDNLKRNDVVKIVSKDKNGKKLTYYAPILNVYGDTIEVISSPGESKSLDNLKTHYINKNNIAGVYMLRQNHDEMLSNMENTLREITDDGINQTTGLTKTSFLNYTPKGTLSSSPNWNDLDAISNGVDNFFDSYTKWRSSITDQEYNQLREENLDEGTIKLLRYARAIDRRRSITDKIGVGGIVQLETVRWIQNPNYTEGAMEDIEVEDKDGEEGATKTIQRKMPKWIKNQNDGFRTVNGVVLAKNGDWLKVRIAKQSFSDGKPISGEYDYETVSVKVTTNHPSLNDKSSSNYAIRAVFKNNTKYVPLVNHFKNLRNTIRTNFQNFTSLIDHYNDSANKNLNLNPDSNEFALFGIKEVGKDYRMNKSADGYVPNAVKSMSDLYDMRLFDENTSSDEKLRMMARLKVGSLVLTKIEDGTSKFPYGTAIVVDFDTRTGKPIIGYAFTPKYKAAVDITDFSARPESYATKTIHPSELMGVGYSKATHKDADGKPMIEMDDFISNDNYTRAQMYIDAKKVTVYDTIAEAQARLAKVNSEGAKLVEVYVSKDGKRVMDSTKLKGQDYVTKHAVMFINQNKVTKKEYKVDVNTPYTTIWSDAFIKRPTKTILEQLHPGDVLSEEYVKDGTTKYIDLVIDDIKGNLVYVTAYYPKKGTSGEDLNNLDNYEQYPKVMLMKPETGVGLPNIRSIKLNFYKHNKDNNSKARRAAITGSEMKVQPPAKPDTGKPKQNDSYNPGIVQGGSRTTAAKSLPQLKNNTQSTDTDSADMSTFFSKAADFKAPATTDVEGLKELGNRLGDIYGVPVENLDSQEILEQFGSQYTNYNIAKQRAFLKDGKIYINTDYATLAEPIHEMSHLVVQGLEVTEPEYYNEIMSKMQSHPFYEKVKSFYPELDEKQLREETFVTAVGEHYYNSPENTKTKDWEKVNQGFFKRLFKSVRNFFAKMFGIEDHKFFRLGQEDLMNSSFNDLMTSFNNRLLDGKFKTEVQMANDKMNTLINGTFLKNATGTKSSLYLNLLESGFDDKFASNSWINTKSSTFVNWHNDEIVKDVDDEPRLFFRTSNPFEVTTDDAIGNGDAVFVKGEITPTESGSFVVTDLDNIKSLFTLGIEDAPTRGTQTIEDFANSKGHPMIGSAKEVAKTISELRNQFGDYNFTSYSLDDNALFYVKYYKSPSENVLKLRNELFSKNLIEATC